MVFPEHSAISKISPKHIVTSFITALNHEDFIVAKSYVSDDMKFTGVMGSRDGAESYFSDMERMRLKYDIKKVFEDGNDICIFYDITMSGIKIFSCGWYHIKEDKISSFRVIFDPRPLLEEKD
jgi:limonene-1,2-epoxide hydrolase